MNAAACGSVPRLSEAKQLLPVISGSLDAATSDHPHCATLELWPIVEEDLFGYELVPERDTHTYVIVGRNASGPTIGANDFVQRRRLQSFAAGRGERANAFT